MDSSKPCPRLYTLPDCPNCIALKNWLEERGIQFEERMFDTEAQLGFIMRNLFGNPPIIEVGVRAIPSEELFVDGIFDEEKIKGLLGYEEA